MTGEKINLHFSERDQKIPTRLSFLECTSPTKLSIFRVSPILGPSLNQQTDLKLNLFDDSSIGRNLKPVFYFLRLGILKDPIAQLLAGIIQILPIHGFWIYSGFKNLLKDISFENYFMESYRFLCKS